MKSLAQKNFYSENFYFLMNEKGIFKNKLIHETDGLLSDSFAGSYNNHPMLRNIKVKLFIIIGYDFYS